MDNYHNDLRCCPEACRGHGGRHRVLDGGEGRQYGPSSMPVSTVTVDLIELRHRRMSRGLTQAGLSRMANVNAQHYSRIESGHKKAGIRTLARIAEVLTCEVGDILIEGGGRNAATENVFEMDSYRDDHAGSGAIDVWEMSVAEWEDAKRDWPQVG